MIKRACLICPLILISCIATSTRQSTEGDFHFVEDLKPEYTIDGLFQNKAELDYTTTNYILWKMCGLAERLVRADDKLSKYLEKEKIGCLRELKGKQNDTDIRIYRLSQCQSLAIAVAIANHLPVFLESLPNTRNDAFYAIFFHYKIVNNIQKVGAAALDADKESIYIEFNLDYLGRVLPVPSKARVDMSENPVTSDLFDLDNKRKFDSYFSNNKAIPISGGRFASGYRNSISIDNLYLFVPASFNEDKIKKMFEEGFGNHDFTYKSPLIERVF